MVLSPSRQAPPGMAVLVCKLDFVRPTTFELPGRAGLGWPLRGSGTLWTGADQTRGQINMAQDVALPQPSRVTGRPGVQGPLGWRSLCLAPKGPQEHSALCPRNPPLISLANLLLLEATFPWEPSLVSCPHLKPRQNQGLHPMVPWSQ